MADDIKDTEEKKKGLSPKLLMIVAGVLAVIVIAIAAYLFIFSGDDDTTEEGTETAQVEPESIDEQDAEVATDAAQNDQSTGEPVIETAEKGPKQIDPVTSTATETAAASAIGLPGAAAGRVEQIAGGVKSSGGISGFVQNAPGLANLVNSDSSDTSSSDPQTAPSQTLPNSNPQLMPPSKSPATQINSKAKKQDPNQELSKEEMVIAELQTAEQMAREIVKLRYKLDFLERENKSAYEMLDRLEKEVKAKNRIIRAQNRAEKEGYLKKGPRTRNAEEESMPEPSWGFAPLHDGP